MSDLTELAREVLGTRAVLNQDCPRYLVLAMASGKPVWVERDDADCDFIGTADDIWSGQIENVVQVISLNVAREECEDVSKDIARAICARAEREVTKLRPDLVDFCEHHLGIAAVNGLRRAA
jgi:hypothetical protein